MEEREGRNDFFLFGDTDPICYVLLCVDNERSSTVGGESFFVLGPGEPPNNQRDLFSSITPKKKMATHSSTHSIHVGGGKQQIRSWGTRNRSAQPLVLLLLFDV